MESVRDAFLLQHVTEPTHYRGDQTPHVLDLVFTNEDNMVSKIVHKAPLGKSHHQVLEFSYTCYTNDDEQKAHERFALTKGDYNTLRDLMNHFG